MVQNNTKGVAPLAMVTLKDPITLGQEKITELHITKKPTLGDMVGIPMDGNLTAEHFALLLGRISNCDTPTCKQITLVDVASISEILQPFLPSTQTIGN